MTSKVEKQCELCRKTFLVYKSSCAKGRYCSKKCYGLSKRGSIREFLRTGRFIKCHFCGKDVYKKLSVINHHKMFFCNTICRGNFFKKENHPFWKGGITPVDKYERIKFYKTIHSQVLERDNYTCQTCKKRGVHLQVDHIQSWKDYVDLRFSIDNCRTLCEDCHYFITYGKKKPERVIWGRNMGRRIYGT